MSLTDNEWAIKQPLFLRISSETTAKEREIRNSVNNSAISIPLSDVCRTSFCGGRWRRNEIRWESDYAVISLWICWWFVGCLWDNEVEVELQGFRQASSELSQVPLTSISTQSIHEKSRASKIIDFSLSVIVFCLCLSVKTLPVTSQTSRFFSSPATFSRQIRVVSQLQRKTFVIQ
jgi:hypothetical protein